MEIKELPPISFSINCSSKSKARKVLASIQKNLPYNWKVANEKYLDNDTFFLLDKVICLETYLMGGKEYDTPIKAKVFIGIIDTKIVSLSFDSEPQLRKDSRVFLIGSFIKLFLEDILIQNKYYSELKDSIDFPEAYDENYIANDIRSSRIKTVYDKETEKYIFLDASNKVVIENKELFFLSPNNISLSLNIMKKALNSAKSKYTSIIDSKTSNKIKLNQKEQAVLYDYFEEIITSITFAYISVESMANAAIPEDYTYKKENTKGVIEIWGKDSIERWMLTSEKLSNILPNIFKTTNITDEPFWPKFKELETLRNNIVHQKTKENGSILNDEIFKLILQKDVFEKIQSSLKVIKFFYDYDNGHPYFPLGLGKASMHIITIDSFNSTFEKHKE